MKIMFKKNLSYIKTKIAYLRHNILNSTIGSSYKIYKRRKSLKSRHPNWYNDLNTKGYTVIHDYLSKKQCAKVTLDLKMAFENYSSFVRETEDKRIFGIEQILSTARLFSQDSELLELGELVNQETTYCAFTLGNWLESGKDGSSGNGWHRDSFFSQYKALLYLTDVTEINGPFEILPGSHHLKSVLKGIKKANLGFMQNRLSESEVGLLEGILKTPRKTLTGSAGTLVLFNSTSVHRGQPIKSGERLALTNYYMPLSFNITDVRKKFSPVVVADNV